MLQLGLTGAQQRDLHRTLAQTHSVRVQVEVRNLSGEPLARLDPDVLDGAVQYDARAPVTRSLTSSLFDPAGQLNLDSDSPANGALYLDRMLRVEYGVKVDGQGWVDVPVFTGPITKLDRDTDLLHIEAQGKEALSMGAMWRPLTIRKGTRKVQAIRIILERAGETEFDLPDLPDRLPRSLSMGRLAVPWTAASKVARSMDRQLLCDGRGRVRLRRPPDTVFAFRDGPGGTLTAVPQVSYSTEGLANVVWVKGGTKKRGTTGGDAGGGDNAKKPPPIEHVEMAGRSHPLSPWRLGRSGSPRFLVHVVENPHIRSNVTARQVAKRELRDHLLQSVAVSFEALPIPHLEELDMVAVSADAGMLHTRLGAFTLPLGVGGTMSVGFNKRVGVPRRRRRNRP